jgi:Ca2+-binding RTX toxin-like protein
MEAITSSEALMMICLWVDQAMITGDIGNDILIGGPGANYFDCGEGIDEVTDFDPAKGDTLAGNCELF